MSPTHSHRAFTLIELLVVITIIVVLLALLTPALDRAIYEAEMAVCMANHAGIAKGASAYAYGYKRYYPYRPSMENENGQFERIQSGLSGSSLTGAVQDDRPSMREFMSIQMFQCPLNEEVDYDVEDPEVWILPSTLAWWGGRGVQNLAESGRHRPLKRTGDRLGWATDKNHPSSPNQDPNDTVARKWNFDYLTSETDWTRTVDEIRTAHPDDEGTLQAEGLQKQSVFLVINGIRSRWISRGLDHRGKINQNYSRTDGSARRINDIEYHDPETVEIREFEEGGNYPEENAEHLPVD